MRDVLQEYLNKKRKDGPNPFVLIALFTLSMAGAVWEEIISIWKDDFRLW